MSLILSCSLPPAVSKKDLYSISRTPLVVFGLSARDSPTVRTRIFPSGPINTLVGKAVMANCFTTSHCSHPSLFKNLRPRHLILLDGLYPSLTSIFPVLRSDIDDHPTLQAHILLLSHVDEDAMPGKDYTKSPRNPATRISPIIRQLHHLAIHILFFEFRCGTSHFRPQKQYLFSLASLVLATWRAIQDQNFQRQRHIHPIPCYYTIRPINTWQVTCRIRADKHGVSSFRLIQEVHSLFRQRFLLLFAYPFFINLLQHLERFTFQRQCGHTVSSNHCSAFRLSMSIPGQR